MERRKINEWRHVLHRNSTSRPSKRWGHRCVMIEHEMVLFGGFDGNYLNDLWVFDTKTLIWTKHSTNGGEMLRRSNFSMNYDETNHRIIVYGGKLPDKKSCQSIWVLDWKKLEWWKLPNNTSTLPLERKYHTGDLFGDYLIIFGGQQSTDLDDLWLYDFRKMVWQEVTFMGAKPNGRRFHASAIIDNQLYIIGGCHGKYEPLNDIWCMNLAPLLVGNKYALKWKQVTNTYKGTYLPRWGHSAIVKQEKIYIFGGKLASETKNDIYVVDTQKLQIDRMNTKNEPSPRRRHSCVFHGSTLLFFGGFQSEYFQDFYYITVRNNQYFSNKQYRHTIKDDMLSLVNNSNYSSVVLTTCDKYRLYVHPSIIYRKIGADTAQFMSMLDNLTLSDAIKELQTIYTGKDKSCLKKCKTQQLHLVGVQSPKDDIITLPEHQISKISITQPEYLDKTDVVQIVCGYQIFYCNLTLLQHRNTFFRNQLSQDFQDKRVHRATRFGTNTMRTLLNFIQFDFVVVGEKFGPADWFQLLLAAEYYGELTLRDMCISKILKIIDDKNLDLILELSLELRVKPIIEECCYLDVQREMSMPFRKECHIDKKVIKYREGMLKELGFELEQDWLQNQRENPQGTMTD